MKKNARILVLATILIIALGVSAWVNLPPIVQRRRAAEHYRAGIQYERAGRMDAALSEWRMAADMDRDYPEPYRKLGGFLLDKADRPDLAAANFRWLAAIDPRGPHVYCNLAKALSLQNEVAEARQYADLAVRNEPNCALANNMQGVALLTDRRIKQGMPFLERSHALAPDNPTYSLVLAKAYLDISDFANAQRVLEEVLARNPRHAEAHYLLGFAYTRQSRRADRGEKALAHFEQAVRLQPDDADSLGEMGKLYLQTGRPEQARAALEKAWAVNPRLVHVAHNLASTYRRLGAEAKANNIEAMEKRLLERSDRMRVLQKQAEMEPGNTDVALERAAVELEDGNLTDAFRYVQAVIQRRPSDRKALGILQRIYVVGGQPEMAEEVRKHIASLPGNG